MSNYYTGETSRQDDAENEMDDSEELDGNTLTFDFKNQNLATLEEIQKVFNLDTHDGLNQQEDEVEQNNNDYYILLLDPVTRRYYRKIIGRDDFIRLQPIIQNNFGTVGDTRYVDDHSSQDCGSQSGNESGRGQNQQSNEQDNINICSKGHTMQYKCFPNLHLKCNNCRMSLDQNAKIFRCPIDNENLHSNYDQCIKQQNIDVLVKMTQMLNLPKFRWTFMGEAESYRRRPFPLKFLKNECSDYPVYVFTSELSKAFDDVAEIETIVDISEFKDTILKKDKSKDKKYEYREMESLVTSTQEFIKNIRRFIFKNFKQTKLQPKPGFNLCLKVDGYREYLDGNYQLLEYERVRYSLRKLRPLRLILTEIKSDSKNPYFPPLFKMDKTYLYPIKHVKNYQIQKELQQLKEWQNKQALLIQQEKENRENRNLVRKGGTTAQKRLANQKLAKKGEKFELDQKPPDTYRVSQQEVQQILHQVRYELNRKNDIIDFEQLQSASQIFWYSPVADLDAEQSSIDKIQEKLKNVSSRYTNDKGGILGSNGLQPNDKLHMNWVDCPTDKQQISITRHRKLNKGTTMVKKNQQIVVDSGECNWQFRFKIVSLERINKIFDEIKQIVATDNKEIDPRNLTLDPEKVISRKEMEKEDHNKKQQPENGQQENENRELELELPKLLKKSLQFQENQKSKEIKNKKQTIKQHKKLEQQEEDDSLYIKQHNSHETFRDIFQHKNFKKILKKKMDYPVFPEGEGNFYVDFNNYKENQFNSIQSPFCNFSDRELTIDNYANIIRFSLGNLTPYKIRLEIDLYHGCEKLVQNTVVEEIYFSNNLHFNKWCNFGDLRYCMLPVKTRLSVNVILVFQEGGKQLTIGCVSMNLFDEKKKFEAGKIDLNLWPFYEIDERLGCMKEYKGLYYDVKYDYKCTKGHTMIKKPAAFYSEFQVICKKCWKELLPSEQYYSCQQGQCQYQEFNLDPNLRIFKEEYHNDPSCLEHLKRTHQKNENDQSTIQNIHNEFSKLVLEFEQFICPMYYSSRDINLIKEYELILNQDDLKDEKEMLSNDSENLNKELAQLKKCFAKSPLDSLNDEEKQVLFKTREHFQTYQKGLPIFLRSVEWHRPLLVNETYKMLKNWALMDPEEAIQLLDAKYPDERVRAYAVERINQLSDDDIALFMLQFAQALLYEEQHKSPLSEMLIERSLANPYVVGQSFYWALKGNLYLKTSYERYYLLLEQFLMLCGKFRIELQIQLRCTEGLKFVQQRIMQNRYGFLEEKLLPWDVNERALQEAVNKKKELKNAKKQQQKDKKANKKGENVPILKPIKKITELAKGDLISKRSESFPIVFNLTVDPKAIIREFKYSKLRVFNSKKVPMMLTMENAQPGGNDLICMFKNGDDLRQDILTLQILAVMDKIWLREKLDLKMTPYKVIGTDCMQGYLEFVDDCETLATMQFENPIDGTKTMWDTYNDYKVQIWMEYKAMQRMEKKVKAEEESRGDKYSEKQFDERLNECFIVEMDRIRDTFIRSCAGYCVASYVLGLGDRHADNIMINYVDGNFLHIDFGHFLGNKKYFQKVIKRETDEFVLTPEIAYFINDGPLKKNSFRHLFFTKYQSKKRALDPKASGRQSQVILESIQGTFSQTFGRSQSTGKTEGYDSDEDNYGNEYQGDQINSNSQARGQSERSTSTKKGDKKKVKVQLKSKHFINFENKCCEAFNVLRKNSNTLTNLFLLMLSAGMPELKLDSDLKYLEKQLMLDKSEQEASKIFKKEIMFSIQNATRRIDNLAHNWKQINK